MYHQVMYCVAQWPRYPSKAYTDLCRRWSRSRSQWRSGRVLNRTAVCIFPSKRYYTLPVHIHWQKDCREKNECGPIETRSIRQEHTWANQMACPFTEQAQHVWFIFWMTLLSGRPSVESEASRKCGGYCRRRGWSCALERADTLIGGSRWSVPALGPPLTLFVSTAGLPVSTLSKGEELFKVQARRELLAR